MAKQKTLEGATEEELLAEIERRKISDEQLRKRRIRSGMPKPLESPDFSRLVKIVKDGLDETIKEEYEDDNFKHFVYEAAMEAVYGPNFWDWRNQFDW